MHEGLLALKQEKAQVARIITVHEVGNEHVGALGAVRALDLPEDKARHLGRERHELVGAMQVAAYLRGKRVVRAEVAVAAVRGAQRLAADALHVGLDGLLLQVELRLGQDAHGGVEIENVQDGLVQADDHACLHGLVWVRLSGARAPEASIHYSVYAGRREDLDARMVWGRILGRL